MKIKVFKSLKSRIYLFVTAILVLFVILVFLYMNGHYTLFNHYDEGLSRYEELADFYDYAHKGHVAFQAALQMDDMSHLDDYNHYMSLARESLVGLREINDFRFGLLENMIDTYDNRVNELLKETDYLIVQDHYDYLERLDLLINDTQSNSYTLLTSININRKDNITSGVNKQFRNILIVTGVVLLVSLAFIVASVRGGIIRPIGILVENAKKVKRGHFEVEVINNTTDELKDLSYTFKDMAHSLENYLDSIKEKSELEKKVVEQENENLRIGKVMAETKLSVFQRQINSHFLFNTLSVIAKLAYIEGATRTNELMVITSDLLRYSVEKSGKISSLSQEIKCCENYMAIQRKRFGDRISFDLIYKPDVQDIRMPAMLLQPLIENSVVHGGVKDMISDASVSVDIVQDENTMTISIKDNGEGIDKDFLTSLTESINTDALDESTEHIGVKNVTTRLKMFYGDNMSFDIMSDLDSGTEVMIAISNTDLYL